MEEPEFSALWAAFRGLDRDRVMVGVAAVFALIASADGSVDATEGQRFLDVVRGSRLAPADGQTASELSQAFSALTGALLQHPERGRAEGLRVLEELKFDPVRAAIIWSAAQTALMADAQLHPAEARVAEQIRAALGVRGA